MTRSTKWFLGILAFLALCVVGFVVLILSVFPLGVSGGTEVVVHGSGQRIAVVDIKGVITSSEDINRQLKKYRTDRSIKGIVLRVDSPGGGVVPSQEIYEEVRRTRDGGKPIVVSMGSLAASGGYYVACGASRLVANNGTLTGSIGVISEFLQLHEALGKLGIGVKTIKSGSLKDAGSSSRKMTPVDQAYFQSLMDDVHRQFIGVVEVERHLPHARVLAFSDGRVFTGQEAYKLGLVDTIGTYEDAIAIVANLAGIGGEPAIVRERRRPPWWAPAVDDMSETVKSLKQEILDRPVLSYRFIGPM